MQVHDTDDSVDALRIGRVCLDRRRRTVRCDGRTVAVEPRVFDLLWFMGRNPGRICSKDELLDAVWHDRVVSESTLYRAIALARELIGDEPPTRIRTVHGRGYELIGEVGPVEPLDGESPPDSVGHGPETFRRRQNAFWIASALGGLVVAAWLLLEWPSDEPRSEGVFLEFGDFVTESPESEFPGSAFWLELRSELARLDTLQISDASEESGAFRRVLEGHWRIDEDELVTHAQLLERSSKRLVWSANFRRPVEHADTLRRDLATAIIEALGLASKNPAGESLPLPALEAPGVYARYLRARSLWQGRDADALLAARKLLESIVVEQPGFARAHEALASVYVVLPDWLDVDVAATRALAWASAREALRIEPRLGEARAVLAQQAMHQNRWIDAESLYVQALAREPGNATIRHWYAEFLLRVGYLERAREQAERAVMIDSTAGMPHAVAAWSALLAGDNEQAVTSARSAVDMGLSSLAVVEAWAAARMGRRAAAAERLEALPNPPAALIDCVSALRDPSLRATAIARIDRDIRQDELAEVYSLSCRAMLGGVGENLPATLPPTHSSAFGLLWSEEFAPLRASDAFASSLVGSGLMAYWRRLGAPDVCRLRNESLECGPVKALALRSDR
ncbi:MAG: hypothetical protein GVY32_09730 [Gammaproteobacteria bacterium]|nr:hypothetical protein [Gammaproteobacteria bacterium]